MRELERLFRGRAVSSPFVQRFARTHHSQFLSLHKSVSPSVARPAHCRRQEADERLEDLELNLDALRDNSLEGLQDLPHDFLCIDSASAPGPSSKTCAGTHSRNCACPDQALQARHGQRDDFGISRS